MQENFVLDCHKKLLIYGAGGNGLKMLDVIDKSGYKLLGFIDKRALTLGTIQGKSAWTMDTVQELSDDADHIVVLITIKNVFEHTSIAYELAKKGFKQCIYKPLPILQGAQDEELEKISRAHDQLVIDLRMPQPQALPQVVIKYQLNGKDWFLIQKNEGEKAVTAWLPLELLFNYQSAPEYENVSMPAFFPLVGLYRLFLGNYKEEEQNIIEDFYSYSSQWAKRKGVPWDEELKKSLLRSRYEAFKHMEQIAEYDFDFFVRNAPEVKLVHSMCRFHMTNSGRNRAAYLAAKGYHHAPVKMSQDDYRGWIQEESYHQLKSYMEAEGALESYAPIPHPFLQELSVRFANYSKAVCYPVGTFLIRSLYRESRTKLEGYPVTDQERLNGRMKSCSLLVCMEDDGALSRYVNAMGFPVTRLHSLACGQKVLLLDRLFRQEIMDYQPEETREFEYIMFDDNLPEEQINTLLTCRASYVIYFGRETNQRLDRIVKQMHLSKVKHLNQILCDCAVKRLIVYKASADTEEDGQ